METKEWVPNVLHVVTDGKKVGPETVNQILGHWVSTDLGPHWYIE
jgi:hypothetical protein